jgi:hypothetical protein
MHACQGCTYRPAGGPPGRRPCPATTPGRSRLAASHERSKDRRCGEAASPSRLLASCTNRTCSIQADLRVGTARCVTTHGLVIARFRRQLIMCPKSADPKWADPQTGRDEAPSSGLTGARGARGPPCIKCSYGTLRSAVLPLKRNNAGVSLNLLLRYSRSSCTLSVVRPAWTPAPSSLDDRWYDAAAAVTGSRPGAPRI